MPQLSVEPSYTDTANENIFDLLGDVAESIDGTSQLESVAVPDKKKKATNEERL